MTNVAGPPQGAGEHSCVLDPPPLDQCKVPAPYLLSSIPSLSPLTILVSGGVQDPGGSISTVESLEPTCRLPWILPPPLVPAAHLWSLPISSQEVGAEEESENCDHHCGTRISGQCKFHNRLLLFARLTASACTFQPCLSAPPPPPQASLPNPLCDSTSSRS